MQEIPNNHLGCIQLPTSTGAYPQDFERTVNSMWPKPWLMVVSRGWNTTQLYRDYNKTPKGSLRTNQTNQQNRMVIKALLPLLIWPTKTQNASDFLAMIDTHPENYIIYTPENKHGIWKYQLGKGDTFTNHQFLGFNLHFSLGIGTDVFKSQASPPNKTSSWTSWATNKKQLLPCWLIGSIRLVH